MKDMKNKKQYLEFLKEINYLVEDDSSGLLLLNFDLDVSTLDGEDLYNFKSAIKGISDFSESELSPVVFEGRKMYPQIYKMLKEELQRTSNIIITEEIVNKVCDKINKEFGEFNYNMPVVRHIASSINTKKILENEPELLIKYLEKSNKTDIVDTINIHDILVLINRESIASWLYNNNIVGVLDNGQVRVLDRQRLEDNKKPKQCKEIAQLLSTFTENNELIDSLKNASAREVVEYIKRYPEYKELLDADAGVWERFSVAEHTESVLRIFDDTYAENLPEEMLPFMRLLLVSHDLGKSKAKIAGSGGQKVQNAIACKNLYRDLEIKPNAEKLLHYIIDESQQYTSSYLIRNDTSCFRALKETCRDALSKIQIKPTNELVNDLMLICGMLQTCDSGAYTRYGITRDKQNGEYYRNGNNMFTMSFSEPEDLRRRRLKFKSQQQSEWQ